MGWWAKSLRMFNAIRDHGTQSVRHLARQTGLSNSSVHRLTPAKDRRNLSPESWLWEPAEGRGWLVRLVVVATLAIFGLTRGVGAETIRAFCGRLRLEAPVGGSPSAFRGLRHALASAILETAAAWERDGMAHGERRPISGAVEETFVQRLTLVLVDLVSGYVLLEEVAVERTYATWYALVQARREMRGVKVWYLVRDRAKALIKLAEIGLGCLSIPDVCHLLHDLVKSDALAIFGRLRHAHQAWHHARERLATCQASAPSRAEAPQAQACVEARAAEVHRWEGVCLTSRRHLEPVSLLVHP
jgi:hypothetical protein